MICSSQYGSKSWSSWHSISSMKNKNKFFLYYEIYIHVILLLLLIIWQIRSIHQSKLVSFKKYIYFFVFQIILGSAIVTYFFKSVLVAERNINRMEIKRNYFFNNHSEFTHCSRPRLEANVTYIQCCIFNISHAPYRQTFIWLPFSTCH